MRIFVFLFSLLLLLYFSMKWAIKGLDEPEEPVLTKQSKVKLVVPKADRGVEGIVAVRMPFRAHFHVYPRDFMSIRWNAACRGCPWRSCRAD